MFSRNEICLRAGDIRVSCSAICRHICLDGINETSGLVNGNMKFYPANMSSTVVVVRIHVQLIKIV